MQLTFRVENEIIEYLDEQTDNPFYGHRNSEVIECVDSWTRPNFIDRIISDAITLFGSVESTDSLPFIERILLKSLTIFLNGFDKLALLLIPE